MTVRYKKIQNKILGSTTYNKWYGKTVSMGTVTTRQLAEEISHSTTVTRSDIMAVLIELSNAIRTHLLNSETVKIDELGSFRVGMKSIATDTKKDFDASKIKGFHIIYRPESSRIAAGMDKDGNAKKVYVKSLLDGISAEELPNDEKKKDDADAGGDTGSDTGGDTGSDTGGGTGSDTGTEG